MGKLIGTKHRRALMALLGVAIALACAFSLAGCAALGGADASSTRGASVSASAATATESSAAASASSVVEAGEYSDRDSVALYIHEFGHLPGNYISKTKARAAGWVSSEGNLWDVLPGKSIGGSEFYDDEDALPHAAGRRWTECDIGYSGGFRGPERIVFSNDGLIYYTPNHYKTFERLY